MDVLKMVEEIYAELGPGHSERVYHNAAEVYLREKKVPYESERHILVHFRGHVVGDLRADMIIDGRIILELKAVQTLGKAVECQAHKYLDLTGLKTAFLVNFPPIPGREVECRKIERGPSEEELERDFGRMLDHHRTVSADLTRLLPGVPGLDGYESSPDPNSTSVQDRDMIYQ
tara:strand:+ start:3036 stop:3557 length:522 start_codon:yes stop_codon:yes gene_type:complete